MVREIDCPKYEMSNDNKCVKENFYFCLPEQLVSNSGPSFIGYQLREISQSKRNKTYINFAKSPILKWPG